MSTRPGPSIRINPTDPVERFRESCLTICYRIKYRAEAADRMSEWDRAAAATAGEIARRILELGLPPAAGEEVPR